MAAQRLVDQVYSAIFKIIEGNDLKVGDRLPSEPRLAETLKVSRTVVREALVRLEADGLTEARRGAGSFVTRRPSALLTHHMPLDQLPSALGTYEVRFVLEPEAARLAAIRHSREEITAISDCLDALRTALLSREPANQEDLDLHRSIMRATRNQAFVDTFEGLHSGVTQIMRAGVEISRSRSAEVIQIMLSEHEDIVEAIRSRDGERSALAMHWHLSQGRRRLMV